jgi:hypothetical protein
MFLLLGQPLAVDVPFKTPDGTQYPANWLRLSTLEEKAAIGITEVPDPTPVDTRFYWDHGIPKDHTQLVEQLVAQDKTTAGQLLSGSDWLVIRKDEIGTAIPPEWEAYRADVRSTCNTREGELRATKTTEELAGLQLSEWPVDPRAYKGIQKKASPGRTRG